MAVSDEWHVENRFLNLRGEQQQVRDLRHACPGQVQSPGCIGQVVEFAVPNHRVDLVRQRKQSHYAGDSARGRTVAPLWPFAPEVHADYGPGGRRVHGATSAASSPNPDSRHWIDIVPAPPS